jgi:hypothetical protein
MAVDLNAVRACLEHLEITLRYRYAQWLVEDPLTWDYRVVAERIPAGAGGYAVAHRTGVIGQAFRTGRAIAVPDTRSHPLYDPFDADVDWELTIPVIQDGNLVAVLNLEGSGALALPASQWRTVREIVSATGWSVEDAPPDPMASGLLKTRRRTISTTSEANRVFNVGKRLAHRGKATLLIGVFPEIARSNSPTACDAEARGMPLAECVRGVGPRLDILQLGLAADGMRAFERLGGWALVEGRYEFALVKRN